MLFCCLASPAVLVLLQLVLQYSREQAAACWTWTHSAKEFDNSISAHAHWPPGFLVLELGYRVTALLTHFTGCRGAKGGSGDQEAEQEAVQEAGEGGKEAPAAGDTGQLIVTGGWGRGSAPTLPASSTARQGAGAGRLIQPATTDFTDVTLAHSHHRTRQQKMQ